MGKYIHKLDFNHKGARYSKKTPDCYNDFNNLLPNSINPSDHLPVMSTLRWPSSSMTERIAKALTIGVLILLL